MLTWVRVRIYLKRKKKKKEKLDFINSKTSFFFETEFHSYYLIIPALQARVQGVISAHHNLRLLGSGNSASAA